MLLEDDSSCKIIGCERVKIKFHDGRLRTLLGMEHIPPLPRNLISISKMLDTNLNFSLNNTWCKLAHRSMLLTWQVQDVTMYRILGSTMMPQCNNVSIFLD